VDNGILVDETLRTSDPDIFAAGDRGQRGQPAAGPAHPGRALVERAQRRPAAARSMLGQPVSYDRVPYFFTDQYDLGMEAAGVPEPGGYDQVVYRGSRSRWNSSRFWLQEGRVVAGMNVNVWDVNDNIRR